MNINILPNLSLSTILDGMINNWLTWLTWLFTPGVPNSVALFTLVACVLLIVAEYSGRFGTDEMSPILSEDER